MNRFELVQARSLPEARSLRAARSRAQSSRPAGSTSSTTSRSAWSSRRGSSTSARFRRCAASSSAPTASLVLGALSTLAEIAAKRRSGQVAPGSRPSLRRSGVAADPQRGHGGRQRPPAASVLVLQTGVLSLPQEGRRRLLCGHGREPLPRHLRRRPRVHRPPVERRSAARGIRRNLRARWPQGRSFGAGGGVLRRCPRWTPRRRTCLAEGEILVEIRVPALPGMSSAYADVRERAGFDWPLGLDGRGPAHRWRNHPRCPGGARGGGSHPLAFGEGRGGAHGPEGRCRQLSRRRPRRQWQGRNPSSTTATRSIWCGRWCVARSRR